MNYASRLLKNKCELFLTIIFIIIIISDKNKNLAAFMNIPQIKFYIFIVAILIFIFCNKLLGILGIFLVYELLNINPKSEITYTTPISTFEMKQSVEEEIIYKMGSTIEIPNYDNKCLYKPYDKPVGFLF